MESKSKSITKAAFPRSVTGLRRMDVKFEIPEIIRKDSTQSLRRNENIEEKACDNQQKNTCESVTEINLDHSMSKSIEDALFYYPLKRSNVNTIKSINEYSNDSSILKLNTDFVKQSQSVLDDDDLYKFNFILPKLNRKTLSITSSKGISLKDFETHREIMEEQKLLRKEELNKANENHLKKTVNLTNKIEQISMELSRLDHDLAIHLGLLRRQIDDANTNFANIEKHYITEFERKGRK